MSSAAASPHGGWLGKKLREIPFGARNILFCAALLPSLEG
jgi:hypothetical protein